MSRPYHICFTFIGDVQFDSRLSKCARSLSACGFRVSVITCSERTGQTGLDNVAVTSIPVSHRLRGFLRYPIFYFRAFLPTLRQRADCYFASDLYSLPLAYVVSKIFGRKLAYDARELYSSIAALSGRTFTQAIWRYVEKRLIRSAEIAFTVNDTLAKLLEERHRIRRPVTLLNCPPRQMVHRSNRLRDLLSIRPEMKILLYQGGIQKGRGILKLLSVVNKVSSAALVFLGDGKMKDDLRNAIKNTGLDDRVFLLDAVPSMTLLEYTASADVGLCLIENFGESYYHSLPNKLFEYTAAGIPIVASDFPEMKTFVESNHVGICVDPENIDEIAAAIQRLITDPALYSSLRENCRRAAQVYAWENEAVKLCAAFEAIRTEISA
jgi:glycosyltransferase involved in cell wall biosynthesis